MISLKIMKLLGFSFFVYRVVGLSLQTLTNLEGMCFMAFFQFMHFHNIHNIPAINIPMISSIWGKVWKVGTAHTYFRGETNASR